MNILINIINIILVYVGELNDELYITQYDTNTNKEHYKINHHADVLWSIQATITAKRIYPYSFHYIFVIDLYNNSYKEVYNYLYQLPSVQLL